MKSVQEIVAILSPSRVWLLGHNLMQAAGCAGDTYFTLEWEGSETISEEGEWDQVRPTGQRWLVEYLDDACTQLYRHAVVDSETGDGEKAVVLRIAEELTRIGYEKCVVQEANRYLVAVTSPRAPRMPYVGMPHEVE
jgi:hypothetical protein